MLVSYSPPSAAEEVLARPAPARRHRPPIVRHGLEDGKVGLHVLAQRHDGRHVAAAVAVVWRRPHRHHVLIGKVVLVALVDELVGARDEREPGDVIELFPNVSDL